MCSSRLTSVATRNSCSELWWVKGGSGVSNGDLEVSETSAVLSRDGSTMLYEYSEGRDSEEVPR